MRERNEIEKEIASGGANEHNQKLIIEVLLDIRDNTKKEPIF